MDGFARLFSRDEFIYFPNYRGSQMKSVDGGQTGIAGETHCSTQHSVINWNHLNNGSEELIVEDRFLDLTVEDTFRNDLQPDEFA